MIGFKKFIFDLRELFKIELFKLGDTPITLTTIVELILVIAIFFIISKFLRRFFQKKLLPRFNLADSVQFIILRLTHYALIIFGVLFAINMVGIQLTSLAVIFGLVGVGLAFGLQNVTSNFVSGVILLFERPINVGDYIQVGETIGIVKAINIRSTKIITFDNITLIVPNSKFIEGIVTNWSVGDPKVRIRIPIGVAYGSNTKLVTDLLLKIAESSPKVLPDPKPNVIFKDFGDSSLNFDLLVWISDPKERFATISYLNYMIDEAFRENKVTIPFPQRDIHIYHNDQ